LMRRFVMAMRGEQPPLTEAQDALESHWMAFAAEEARLLHKIINMKDFRSQAF